MKILFVTNLCTHYRVGLFELLANLYNIEFLFFSKQGEGYDGDRMNGDFPGSYVDGFYILPKIKINPGLLWKLMFGDYTHLIKCINNPFALIVSFVIAKLRGKPFILWTGMWSQPQTAFHKISFPFVKFIYRHSDAIVVYGSHVKKYLMSLGVSADKIAIAWQAQDNAQFTKFVSEKEKKELKRELGVNTPRVILFVGRLVEEKGIRILLDAYEAVRQENVSLLIIGRGELESEVTARIASLPRAKHIKRIPPEQLYLYYALADIFVLPSITTKTFKEPWGFVVNEAMCQGAAVICTDSVGAGVGGLIENGRNGFVIPENNSPELARTLNELLNNQDLLAEVRTNARRTISEWTYPKMAGGFVEAINIAGGDISTSNKISTVNTKSHRSSATVNTAQETPQRTELQA